MTSSEIEPASFLAPELTTLQCARGITKLDFGVKAILRFDIRNVRGSNVGITDGRDL
jgi:hypothetical protein